MQVIARLLEVERESSEAKVVTLRAIADNHESEAELVDQAREHQEAGDAHYRRRARCLKALAKLRSAR